MSMMRQGTKENSLTMYNPLDKVAKQVERMGGCKDWPCDYACLRRGRCDHEKGATQWESNSE